MLVIPSNIFQNTTIIKKVSPGTPVFSTNKTDCHDIAESGGKHHKSNQTIDKSVIPVF
jgi:hypothetical protein